MNDAGMNREHSHAADAGGAAAAPGPRGAHRSADRSRHATARTPQRRRNTHAGVILTVTLNAALDVTYQVPAVKRHGSNRVETVTSRAGGKGINVARVLAQLGRETIITGTAGGATGEALRADLAHCALREALVPIGKETRRTVAVVDQQAGDVTMFNEAGPTIASEEWSSFVGHYWKLLAPCSAVVLAGSLPPGLPQDAYATLVRTARACGVPVILDTSAPWLLPGLAAGPDLVKPNADELRESTGLADPVRAAGVLLTRGARAVVASLGADGMLAVTPHGAWRASPPQRFEGNPTGAGDSAVAALALGLATRRPWPERLAQAVALSAATVCSPMAGTFDAAVYQRLISQVHVQHIQTPFERNSRAPGPHP